METIISLRPAEPSDYDRIVPVMDGWWGRTVHGGLPRLFLDHFAHTSLIAEQSGDLAGFLVGFLSPAQPDVAYIHFVGVNPEHRGSGLARRLYLSFFDLAVAGGRTVVRAITSPQNQASIAFHRAMGFTVTGPVTDYDGPGTDRVRFERSLAS